MSQRYTISEHGPKIDAFLKKLLPLLGIDVHYEMAEHETVHPEFENPDIRVKFSGRDVDQLLSNKTEVMLALEHITLEMLRVSPEEHSRICFDANDHRMLRIEELRASAVQAADRVKSTNAPFRFNPMNSRERRVLHLALRGETTLRSESEGLEPRRDPTRPKTWWRSPAMAHPSYCTIVWSAAFGAARVWPNPASSPCARSPTDGSIWRKPKPCAT